MRENSNTRVLLVGHGADLVGADRYIFEQAELLVKYGYYVECIVFENGPLKKAYLEQRIPFFIYPISQLNKQKIFNLVETYDIVIANTMYAIFFAFEAQKYKPTMLILHDCPSYMDKMLNRTSLTWEEVKQIRHLYGVSEYHADMLKQMGIKDVQVLNNFVKDTYLSNQSKSERSKIRFLTVANWNQVKGYDLALQGFMGLTEEEKGQIKWQIVGKMESEQNCIKFQEVAKKKPWITFYGVIDNKRKLKDLYIESDLYLHMSREDSCPLAVVDAAMLQKPMIVSKDTGAKYLADDGGGWVVDEYDCVNITKAIREAITQKNELVEMGKRARKNYLKNATPEVYVRELIKEINRVMELDKTVLEARDTIRKLDYMRKVYPHLRIALYGYNMYAQIEYFYVKKSGAYELVGIFDRAYESYQKQGIEIKNPDELRKENFDYVCICCVYDSTIQAIKQFLSGIGIPKEKISIGINSVFKLMEAEQDD